MLHVYCIDTTISSFFTFTEKLSNIDYLSFWMKDFKSVGPAFFLFWYFFFQSDLLFHIKKLLNPAVVIAIFQRLFPMFYSLVKREQKKRKYIGRQEKSSKRTYSFLCTSRWMLRASSRPGNQLKIRLNTVLEFIMDFEKKTDLLRLIEVMTLMWKLWSTFFLPLQNRQRVSFNHSCLLFEKE